jgi:dTDP-D-glucose 4,6-dehydratase
LSQKYLRKSGKAGFVGSLVVTSKSETITKSAYILVNDKLSNAGEIQFKILDKGFVTEKEFKKII